MAMHRSSVSERPCAACHGEPVSMLQDYVNAKRAEHAALDKDYQAFTDAKKAVETAKEKTKAVRETVKSARAAVREALKTVSDPPAVVRRHPTCFSHCRCGDLRPVSAVAPSHGVMRAACWHSRAFGGRGG